MIVKGLGSVLPGQTRDPDLLKSRLTSVLSLYGVPEFTVVSVISYPPPSNPVYDVTLGSADEVESILRESYKFSRRRDPVVRPPELKSVTLYHSVTPGTRVRISLLRVRVVFFFL